jgi:hypothetical protein
MNSKCPSCKQTGFPVWIKAFAVWPLSIRCRKCNVKLRLNIPRWQNILVQILGQFVFWAMLLTGLRLGLLSAIAGGIIGAFIAMLIALAPGLFAELEVLPTKDAR